MDPFVSAAVTIAVAIIIIFLLVLVLWFSGMMPTSSSAPVSPPVVVPPIVTPPVVSPPVSPPIVAPPPPPPGSPVVPPATPPVTPPPPTVGSQISATTPVILTASSFISSGNIQNLSLVQCSQSANCGNQVVGSPSTATAIRLVPIPGSSSFPGNLRYGDTVNIVFSSGKYLSVCSSVPATSGCGSLTGATIVSATNWRILSQTKNVGMFVLTGDTIIISTVINNTRQWLTACNAIQISNCAGYAVSVTATQSNWQWTIKGV